MGGDSVSLSLPKLDSSVRVFPFGHLCVCVVSCKSEMGVSNMHGYNHRFAEKALIRAVNRTPVAVILTESLEPEMAVVVAPVDASYAYKQNVTVENPGFLTKELID